MRRHKLKRKYFYLIAGLPELGGTDQKAEKDAPAVLNWIRENLEPEDLRVFNYIIYRNDNKNLLYLIRRQEGYPESPLSPFQEPAVFDRRELEEGLHGLGELPAYMERFLEEERVQPRGGRRRENRLKELYYEEALQLPLPFLRGYFAFKRDLKNILCALNARKYGLPVSEVLIEPGDLRATLESSAAPDFGLGRSHEYVQRLSELMEAEHMELLELEIDAILADYIDRNSALDFYGPARVCAYALKLSLKARWMGLEKSAGMKALEDIRDRVLKTAEWPEEIGFESGRGAEVFAS